MTTRRKQLSQAYYPTLGNRHKAARDRWRPTGHLMLPAQGLHLLRKMSLIGFVRQHTT